ncbi:non-ribosomal peptide synthetase module [Annulohypoxylon maeteangense]|uniref:non-ribosomal peptide synthetase module n=1 Tax=Annulohypoxylon maeteangense TaxID=1927788 RepID=UPI002007B742|nr:non-ribosomal peptide synthetase module [Annulohypoxylon maeteangense]KAI0881677.1 non-ribosomal peptide synthetase module [Annulohypoxylon maeteangense]
MSIVLRSPEGDHLDPLNRIETIEAGDHDSPALSTKEQLREIWAEILQDEPSSFADEDVFFEVGGDSISAQKLITAAKGLGIILTMEQLFVHASIEEMAEVASLIPFKEIETNAAPFSSLSHLTPLQDIKASIAEICNVSEDKIENAYPCSPMQKSLAGSDQNSYVRQFVFKMTDDTPLDAFWRAWEETVQENPILRTRICHLGNRLGYVQAILDEEPRLNINNTGLHEFLQQDASSVMAPGDPYSRYAIVVDRHGEKVGRYFVWTIHHAVCDGASLPLLLDEVSMRFRAEPTPERPSFDSFIQAINALPYEQEEKYWKAALADSHPAPYPHPPQSTDVKASQRSTLERPLDLGDPSAFGVTKALFMRAAWAILLSHYTGTEDVGFGVINNGRTSSIPGVPHMTGPTINLVPINLRIDPEETIASFLARVRVQAGEMTPFEHSGIAKIRTYLARGDSAAFDFQTLLVVHPQSFSDAISSSTQTLGLQYIEEVGKKEEHPYPLVLSFTLSPGNTTTLRVEHDEGIVTKQQAQNLVFHLQAILAHLNHATRDTALSSISPFSQQDMAQIREWNPFTHPTEETYIHHLFQKQVFKQPNAVAVYSQKRSLTYLDVDNYSSSLAAQLLERGVRSGAFVGVCFEKSIWTVVAILAVFKAGGVYVPIDPDHPRARIEEVVRMAGIEISVASNLGADVLNELSPEVVKLSDEHCPSTQFPVTPPSKALPSSIAYLQFTSGSTGKPKGILIPHSAICTSIKHHGEAFGANPEWRTLQFCSHTFDISVAEFFTTLAFGGCICIPTDHDRLNNLAGAIRELKANTLLCVPTIANLLYPQDVPGLKTIVLGGEPITKKTITRWADYVDLTAGYGPSETAVYSSGNLCISTEAHPANIGRSIGANMWVVGRDNPNELCAIGCVGEIAISGPLIGGGYFNDRAATEAAFVPAPDWLKADKTFPHTQLYRTGDLARNNPDGTFHIIGRKDTQVKLRGFRIELGEIENQIMATGAVSASVAVLPAAGPCARQLVAIVSCKSSEVSYHSSSSITISKNNSQLEKIKQHLFLVLPSYMIPTVWICLEEMPQLISGKIDRKAIKQWIQSMPHSTYNDLMGNDPIEENIEIGPGSLADKLRELWSETLDIPKEALGMNTLFFASGGDSISAMQIVSRAREIGLVVTVRGIMSAKTLGGLVAFVRNSQDAGIDMDVDKRHDTYWTSDIIRPYEEMLASRLRGRPSLQVEDAYPTSPFAREIMKQRLINPHVFILSWQMEIFSLASEPISLKRLARAWRRVIQKYPVLRSIYLRDDTGELPLLQVVLSADAASEATVVISSAEAEDDEPTFDLVGTPSVDECFIPHRAHFVRHGDRYYIHIELDHQVIDGWSLRLIKLSLLEAYENDENYKSDVPPPYKAIIAARTPSRIEDDDQYWASVLANRVPSILSLPVSSREPIARPSPRKTVIYLPEIKAQAISAFGTAHGITSASLIDAAWAQTLSTFTGASDVSFEYITSGRNEDVPDVFDIVGLLINAVPYHLSNVSTGGNALDLARLAQLMQEQRNENSMHDTSNVRDVVQKQLKVGRLWNTAVNFQRRPSAVSTATLKVEDLLRKSVDPWHFDVLVRALHITDDATIRPSFEFDAQVFDQDRMKEVAEHFWTKLQLLIS